jgi:uncharacterized membrane protein YdjX (TVP38/TMEM64 family)
VSRPLYQRKRFWSTLLLLAAVALALWHRRAIAVFVNQLGWEGIRAGILASGPWAPLLCILLYAFTTVFFLPTTLVGILVALIFGPFLGLPIALAGLALGMGLSFLIARYLLHGWIERRIGDTRLYRRIEEHMHREGWKLIVFTRMLPVNPFTFLNYACGLTRIPFWIYLAASVVGVIPNTVALLWTTHAAGQLAAGKMDLRVALLLAGGALLFGLLAWLPRLLRRKMPEAIAEPGDDSTADL